MTNIQKKIIEEPVQVEVDMEELLKRGYTYEQVQIYYYYNNNIIFSRFLGTVVSAG